MTGMSSPATRFDLRSKLVILSLTLVFAALAIWMVTPHPPVGFNWDDTWYLLMAEWISGRSDTQELAWTMLQLRQYPPLFSYALVLSGSGLFEHSNAFVMNALFLVASLGVAMIWFRREGFSLLAMGVAATMMMLNPVALYWLPTLFSEHLFIFLSTVALALACTRRAWPQLWLVIGILVGLAIATRSPGWALAAGMFAHLVFHRRISFILLFLFGLAIGLITIPYFAAGLPVARSYMDGIRETLEGINLAYLKQQFSAVAAGWQLLWGSVAGAVIAAFITIPGLLLRLKSNRPDAWYVFAYCGMLLIWPFPDHMNRFLWPLMPSMLIAGHEVLALQWRLKFPSWLPGLVIGLILLASIPAGFGKTLNRLLMPPPTDLTGLSRMPEWTRSGSREVGLEVLETRSQLLDDMNRINLTIGENYCVYSELPAMVTAQTQRVSFASPWSALSELDYPSTLCAYYYLIPAALPRTDAVSMEQFSKQHEELFRSMAPYDPTGVEVLGVFYHLKAPLQDAE